MQFGGVAAPRPGAVVRSFACSFLPCLLLGWGETDCGGAETAEARKGQGGGREARVNGTRRHGRSSDRTVNVRGEGGRPVGHM